MDDRRQARNVADVVWQDPRQRIKEQRALKIEQTKDVPGDVLEETKAEGNVADVVWKDPRQRIKDQRAIKMQKEKDMRKKAPLGTENENNNADADLGKQRAKQSSRSSQQQAPIDDHIADVVWKDPRQRRKEARPKSPAVDDHIADVVWKDPRQRRKEAKITSPVVDNHIADVVWQDPRHKKAKLDAITSVSKSQLQPYKLENGKQTALQQAQSTQSAQPYDHVADVVWKDPRVGSNKTSQSSVSFARGPSEPALIELTIPEHFRTVVDKYGHRPAVLSQHQKAVLTYNDLDRQSDILAQGLRVLGVHKNDKIAVSLGNCIEYVVVIYALYKLGAILVPLNPSFSSIQVASALNRLDISYVIISTEVNLSRKPARSNSELLTSLEAPQRKLIIVDNSAGREDLSRFVGAVLYDDLLNTKEGFAGEPLHNNDVINIQFTSGTTSEPKAAALTHRGLLNNGIQIGDVLQLTSEDIVCCPPPLFHCFGCVLGLMATATHGACIAFPSEAFDARAALTTVRDTKATALYGVPTMFSSELELISKGEFSSGDFKTLRTGIAAGSSIPSTLMQKIREHLGLRDLVVCYGMTETSPVSCMTRIEDSLDRRLNTVGRALPHIGVKVIDKDGKLLKRGERGELAVSGYPLMKGYVNDSVKTAEAVRTDKTGKKWMLTGDEAKMDQDGYISITGRIKDLIIRGGENIHPLEIENCLLAHPKVSEAYVVGLPDERYGEIVAAFVVKQGDLSETEVKDWVREQLSGHLVPAHVFWVDDFPKTASGKVQKFKLVEAGTHLMKHNKASKL